MSGGGARLFAQILPWLAALVGLVCLGALAVYLLRRILGRSETTPDEGFTLQQLRDLRAAGTLSDQEFERAKAAIIGRLSQTLDAQGESEPGQSDPGSTDSARGGQDL